MDLSVIFLSGAIFGMFIFLVLLVILPAVCCGALSVLAYDALQKLQLPVSRFTTAVPVVSGLFLCVIIPYFSYFSLIINLVIEIMGVLTSFLIMKRFFPDRYLKKILFCVSAIAIAGRFLYGFGMAFGGSGDSGSPVFQLLTSISSTDEGFLIMNSIALYLEMVIVSALIFGALFVAGKIYRKIATT
jgi:hypothetical protein